MISKLIVALIMAAPVPVAVVWVHADEPTASTAPAREPSPPNSLPAVRAALREFDRFLDHHPVLEDQLRLDSQLAASKVSLNKNPELIYFLHANPKVVEGLKIYPRYFLNRALLRQASAPVSFKELTPLKDLFQQQPGLERELTINPELVRDPAFLESHPELRDCLVQHPVLNRVFLPPPSLRNSNKNDPLSSSNQNASARHPPLKSGQNPPDKIPRDEPLRQPDHSLGG